MKLISLNTWQGKYFDKIVQFINKQQETTDIFCFQEIYNASNAKEIEGIEANLFNKLQQLLPLFNSFFVPAIKGYNLDGEVAYKVDFNLEFGLAIFIKKEINTIKHSSYQIYGDSKTDLLKGDFSNLPIIMQRISCLINRKLFDIYNFHGIPKPGSKLDTPDRLDQSRRIKEIMDKDLGLKILVGDFNLLPETQSIKILENEFRNLITEFNIKETRSKLSPYYATPQYQRYADYAFVSSGVVVEEFEVPYIEVSDHLPLVLKFS